MAKKIKKYPSAPYYPYKGSTLHVNKSYDKNHVQPSVFNHGGPGPHIDPTALEQANANINTANTSASNYFSNPDNFAPTQKILNEYANVGNYKPITYSGGFTNTGNTVFGGYNSPVNQTNTLTGGEFYNNNEEITDLPIISYNDFTDKKGQHFYVPNYGIKTPAAPIDRNLATETAQRPVMQNVPLQTNKMKSKVEGANNKYMKNVGTKHFQTQALDEQGNPMMEDYSVFKQGDKTINERTYNTALRKQQGEQAAYETELLKAEEQINKFKTYGGPMKKNYKNGGDKKKYIPTEKQQILIDKGLLSYKDALGGEGPKTNTAWKNYTSKQGGTNIRQVQDSLIKQGLLTEEALKSDKGLWGDASEDAYQNFLNNTDISGNDFLTSALPLNVAGIADDLGGNLIGTKKTDVFTANNLKQSEKDFMLNAARENLTKGKPYMEYADYKTHLNPDGTVKESAYKEKPDKDGNTRYQYFDVGTDRRTTAEKAVAEFDPGYNLKTYLGQAPFSVIPAFRDRMYNDTIVTDQYNFNNAGELTEKDKKKLINFTDPYGMARTAGKGYGSAEGKGGRNIMAVLNNDNNKKEINSNTVSNAISDAATQVIGGTGLGLVKKGYDYFNKANGGNLYPYGGPTKDIKKLMIAEGINPEHYDKYKDTIDNIYTEIKKPGEYSPGFMDNLKIKAASKYYPNVNEIINKFDAGTFNMGGYMKYHNGGQGPGHPHTNQPRVNQFGNTAEQQAALNEQNLLKQKVFATEYNTLGQARADKSQWDNTENEFGFGDLTYPKQSQLDSLKNAYNNLVIPPQNEGIKIMVGDKPGYLQDNGYMQYANGGQFDTGGQMGEFSGVPVTEFNNGGSHEANPNGGIPQGPSALVEEGELKLDLPNGEQYIVSPKIMYKKNDKEVAAIAEQLGIGEKEFKRFAGKDMVSVFKSLTRKNSFNGEKREGDTIQENSIEADIMPFVELHTFLTERKNAQEEAKKEQAFAQDMDMMMQEHPEYMQAMMAQQQQQQAPQQQQGPSPEEQAMMEQQMMQQQGGAPQGMPPMMGTYGGKMNPDGSVVHFNNGGYSYSDYLAPQQAMPVQGVAASGYAQGGQMQQAPQQGGQEQEIMGQVAQALQQGITQGIEQGMSQEEATQQAAQGIMGKLVESGMPEEQAGGLIQGVMQQLEGGQQGQPMATGGMMPQQYKNGAGMKVAGNILSTASPFLSAIPAVGPILTPIAAGVGSGLTEAGNQKAENPDKKIKIQDVVTKTAIGAGASFIPGVGAMVGSMANKLYDETLDSSKKSQAEIQEILNNPEHPEYEKTLKSMQESAESNKGADLTNNIINTGMQVAGGIASNQANTVASNVEGMDAFAAAGGAPEGTTTGYSGGKFSGANDMGNYSSYAPGFTAGPDGTAVPTGNANGGYMQYINGGVMNTPVNYNYGGRKQYVTGGTLLGEDPPVDLAATGINKNNFFQKVKFRDVSGKTVAKDSFIALEALSDYGFNPKGDTVLTSLTRTAELNKKVGGVDDSLHLTGKAMDISSKADSKEFIDWTNTTKGKKWVKDFNIDKVDETGKQGASHWHFEFNPIKDTSSIKNYDTYATTFEDNKDANTGMINLDTYSSNPKVTKKLQGGDEVTEENKNIETITADDGMGNKYVGEIKDGEWHGQGTFTYDDGSKYVGEWKNGKKNGQGIETFADGHQEKVFYENNEWRDEDSPFAQKSIAQDKINNMGQAAFDALPEEERKKLLSAAGTSFLPTEEEQKLMEEKQAVLDEVVSEQALKLNKTPETVLKTLLAMDPAERDKMLDERLTKNLEENKATNTVTSPPVSNTTTNAPTNNAPGNLNPSKPIEDIDTDKLEEAELDAQTEAEMFADAPKSNFKEWDPKDWIEDGYDYTQDLDDTVRENQYLKPTLLENMIGAAPGIANIAMGLGKDDKLKLDRVDPISAKYISLDESRKANERLLAAQQAATKNVAGNAGGGNYLANMQATYLKYLQGMSGIDQQEQNANAQIGNQTAAQNAQIAAQNAQLGFREQDYAARTEAAKKGMIGTGIGQIADVYQGNRQNKFMTNTYLPTVSPDYAQFYKWQKDPNKNWLGLNKKNKG